MQADPCLFMFASIILWFRLTCKPLRISTPCSTASFTSPLTVGSSVSPSAPDALLPRLNLDGRLTCAPFLGPPHPGPTASLTLTLEGRLTCAPFLAPPHPGPTASLTLALDGRLTCAPLRRTADPHLAPVHTLQSVDRAGVVSRWSRGGGGGGLKQKHALERWGRFTHRV